jgi:phospholipase C
MWVLCFMFGLGLSASSLASPQLLGTLDLPVVGLTLAVLAGAVSLDAGTRLGANPVAALVGCLLGCLASIWPVGRVLEVPVDLAILACFTIGAAALAAIRSSSTRVVWALVPTLTAASLTGSVAGAGAWSVDEPGATDPRMVAGNGIVVDVDTHAFLIQQAAVILRNDHRPGIADFLTSPDPTAPLRRTANGRPTAVHEDYLWRMQLGARDADRKLKAKDMPDHFFNWFTHSGKGLIAGPSAATWAEQQYTLAAQAWETGDKAPAMYHLGAATHLVDDACAPPHESLFVPNHRAYENWMMTRQNSIAVTRGGIYQEEFRVRTGHGGPEWSSSHTRGWVDECSHRAAELVINTAQRPPGDPASGGAYDNTFTQFRDTQRLTAGYVAFFFDSVGGPR